MHIYDKVEKFSSGFRNAIPKWLYSKTKKIKNPLKPWKKKTVRKQKIDPGKLQVVLLKIIDKVNEIIENYPQWDELQDLGVVTELWETMLEGQTNPSDRRLKYDVNMVGTSPSGLNIYTFRFKDKDRYGKFLYQGVISDEMPQSIVTQNEDGYDLVNYSQIDVNFVRVNKL